MLEVEITICDQTTRVSPLLNEDNALSQLVLPLLKNRQVALFPGWASTFVTEDIREAP